jgi:hypothetical protein
MNRLFAPSRRSVGEKMELVEAVEVWRQDLPDGVRDWKESDSIWIHLLHLAYKCVPVRNRADKAAILITSNSHLKILVHRNALVQGELNIMSGDDQNAIDAACRITRIVEDMLYKDMIRFGQMHSQVAEI